MVSNQNIAGVILAGGLARRMGGGDKASRLIAGRSMFERVKARLAPQVTTMALNANGEPGRLANLGLPVIPDSISDFPGPLAGVLAGMDWAAAQGASHILSVAADTPFFPTDLGARLAKAISPQAPIALAATPDPKRGMARHPTFGLWPVALADDLRVALDDGVRKVVLWTDRHGAATVPFTNEPFDPFFNVNTPDDMAIAEALAKEHGFVRVYGVVGWKNAGKTTLMERLVSEITGRGFSVSTIKHAHHVFDVDRPGKDSYRHREAGAEEVLVASGARWALMHELRETEEPPLQTLLSKLSPVDLILIEGYKRDSHAKVEAYRAETGAPLIAADDPTVKAIATNDEVTAQQPLLPLDDPTAIADFILSQVGLPLKAANG